MANLSDILLLGDERLYQKCLPVEIGELPGLLPAINQMAELILKFRYRYGKGRAIAAPQIGIQKRIIVLNIDKPIAIYNPILEFPENEMFSLWDDCMSFPNLLVKVNRYRKCRLSFKDQEWNAQSWDLEDDLSELMQHEYDHLEGILATQRAIDNQSFKFINI